MADTLPLTPPGTPAYLMGRAGHGLLMTDGFQFLNRLRAHQRFVMARQPDKNCKSFRIGTGASC